MYRDVTQVFDEYFVWGDMQASILFYICDEYWNIDILIQNLYKSFWNNEIMKAMCS